MNGSTGDRQPNEGGAAIRSVLVVDDSRLARMAIASTLERVRPGWRVVEAANAEQGREAVQGGGVDIVLIDFNMPGTDGLALAEEIRAARPQLPIALVTANIQDSIIQRARAIDIGFVAKPVGDDELAAFLSGAALRLRRAGSGGGA